MRRSAILALCAPLLLLLAACAAQPDRPMNEARAETLLEIALSNVEKVYYRETAASAVVEAGLAEIAESHPGIAFTPETGRIVAKVSGTPVHSFEPAADRGASDTWGTRLATALDRVAAAMPEGGPDLDGLTNAFLKGVAGHLDKGNHYWPPPAEPPGDRYYNNDAGRVNVSLKPDTAGMRITALNSFALEDSGLLRIGDVITAIDGEATKDLPTVEVFYRLRGPIGSAVALSIQRQGEAAQLTVELTREIGGAGTVAIRKEGSTHRILLKQFGGGTGKDVKKALQEILDNKDQPAQGFVLDLRDNGGGLLDSTIATSDLFLGRDTIVSTHGRHPDSHQYFKGAISDITNGLPLIVLVDRGTASGAEIIAAALQGHNRAIVIGEPTYGLGTIRTVMPLPNRGYLALTWTEITTAAGYRLDKRGVMPAVCTGGSASANEVLAAFRGGGGVTDRATQTRDIDPDDAAAVEAFRAGCPPREDGAEVSLEVARALLADPALYAEVLASAAR